jgi:hypothetical protein
MASEGRTPLLKKSRWLLLKREENLKTEQRFRLRDLLRKPSSNFGSTVHRLGPESSWTYVATFLMWPKGADRALSLAFARGCAT